MVPTLASPAVPPGTGVMMYGPPAPGMGAGAAAAALTSTVGAGAATAAATGIGAAAAAGRKWGRGGGGTVMASGAAGFSLGCSPGRTPQTRRADWPDAD